MKNPLITRLALEFEGTGDRQPDAAAPQAAEPPLVVDVDGTLVRTDLLVESAVHLLMSRPLDAVRLPFWLLAGKDRLKTEIADRIALEIDTLPLDGKVLAFMAAAKTAGREVYLASASDARVVAALAARVGGVDGIFATGPGVNLAGRAKRDRLVAAFGEGGFDYIGNSAADVAVWEAARRGYVIRNGFADPGKRYTVAERPLEVLARNPFTLKSVLKAARVHQWAKNVLLFVPLVLGGGVFDSDTVLRALLCFLAFGLLASATYIANDVIDVQNDRRHRSKRHRPLASGALSIPFALLLVLGGGGLGLALGALLGTPVLLGLLGYTALTFAYSWRLKRVPVLDTALLAGLYTWRLFVGILVAGVMLSPWLLVFSFAFFLSLSLAKRHTEIAGMAAAGRDALPGRGYRTVDGPLVMAMGVAAGVSSLLVFVLYLIEGAFAAATFTLPQALWALPVILLLWLGRVWLLCGRGELHDDPVEFAVVDHTSHFLGGLAAATVIVALLA